MATSLVQAKQFWHLREHISEAIRKEGHGIYFDISLPVAALADFIKQTGRRIRAASSHVILAPFGHIGDGNLHYNMCFTYPPDDFAGVKKRIQAIVYEEVIERHGSLSAEHGIGIERKAELSHYRSPTELALMKKIKNAIDPDGLMNPGKIFE